MTALPCLLALSLLAAPVPSPHTPITPASMTPRPDTRLARRAHRLTISGSVALITSGAAWGVMLGGMALGALDRRQYNALVDKINAEDRMPRPSERDLLADYDRYGSFDNTSVIAGAVVGTALAIVGAALLGRGLVLSKSTRRQGRLAALRLAASWRPTF